MSRPGVAPCAAVTVSSARAEASRRNGARSRGPKTPEGKARAAQNALKHGLRAQKYVVLPEEDASEFAALEAAMIEELAPVGAMQTLLARRVAVAAWRLARADRLEVEVLQQHQVPQCSLGLALIRDGNGTRSFETLLRYRGAAIAEFWRALRTLKALQAEQAALDSGPALAAHCRDTRPARPAARPPLAHRLQPDEPEHSAGSRLDYVPSEPPASGRTLHEPAGLWMPNEPEARQHAASPTASRTNPAPDASSPQAGRGESCPSPSAWRAPNEPEADADRSAMRAHGR